MANLEDKVKPEEVKTEAGCATLIYGSCGLLVYGYSVYSALGTDPDWKKAGFLTILGALFVAPAFHYAREYARLRKELKQ